MSSIAQIRAPYPPAMIASLLQVIGPAFVLTPVTRPESVSTASTPTP